MAQLGADDPRFSDPRWMAATLARHGQMWIAIELGVSRWQVRKQLDRLGIASQPSGRRRAGAPNEAIAPTVADLDRTEAAIVDLYRAKRRAGHLRSAEETFADVLKAWYAAQAANDENAIDAAILDGAAALGVIHRHRQTLRRAA